MTLKTYTIEKKDESRKQVWEWEETPELAEFIAKQTGKEILKDKPTKKDET